jgi:uncharacterized membrane protein
MLTWVSQVTIPRRFFILGAKQVTPLPDPSWCVGLAVISVFCWAIILLCGARDKRTQILVAVLLIVIVAVLGLPIWNWHPDLGGQMHGHPFWNPKHEH